MTLAGCATQKRIEYVYLSTKCTVPPIVYPEVFNWDDLKDAPLQVKVDINETIQTLIDEVLIRQAMLVEICENGDS